VRLIGCIPSLLALMALNALTKETFARAAIVSVPPPLFGMFAMFAFLLALPERAADKAAGPLLLAAVRAVRVVQPAGVPGALCVRLACGGRRVTGARGDR